MGTTTDSSPLETWYENSIGEPTTSDEVYGYWVFVLGVLAGFVGIMLVMLSDSPGQTIRGAGIALASLGLVLLLIGPIIRLPLGKKATSLSYVGAVVAIIGVIWFAVEFNAGNWGAAFEHNESLIIGLYGIGVLIIAVGGILTPMITTNREAEAEARAAQAEAERDAARADATEQADAAAEERGAREALAAELQRIEDSQSQFELYTDNGGKHRWRLRHRNRNIIADSSQGYSSRQKAQQGLSAVRRDAFGAAVVDLDKMDDIEVEDVDDAVEGDDAPAFLEDVESQATFETYEDEGGEYRWRLRHDNGEIIADSAEGYSRSDSRDEAVDSVRQYVQAADYLRIDPAAFELYQDKGGKYRWRLLHKNGNILADSGEGYASRQKARQGVDSVQSNVGDEGKAEFEVYEDNRGEYRWRLVHQNGNLIADSGEGYSSERGAKDAVERIQNYAPEAHVLDIGNAAFEIYKDEGGEWRWRLRHRNGNVMADSGEGYAERTGAEDGINSVKQHAVGADVTDIT